MSGHIVGSEFLLWANPREIEAVRVVDIFLSLATVVARDAGLNQLSFHPTNLHVHFPPFARSYCEELEYANHAVSLYDQAKGKDPGDGYVRISTTFYLQQMPEAPVPSEYVDDIMEKAARLNMRIAKVDRTELMANVKIILGNILNKTI